jgi:RNA polymerase sigma-70 factor, ECF subfamily
LTQIASAGKIVCVEANRECDKKTLGDVLYSDRGRAGVPEADWLRLVQAVAAGDQIALHSLYEQTHRIVFTLIFRIVKNRETAEELTLDVFHDVWRKASSYDAGGGSVVGWIMNQARSRAIDRWRFEHRKKRVDDCTEIPVAASSVPDPQQACIIEEQHHLLRSALEVLTPDERTAIESAFFAELTYTEVAAKLNEPLGTIKTRIRSGLAKLRQSITSRIA